MLSDYAGAQFDMFLKNSFGVLFFTFFLFQLTMSSFAFMVSTAVSRASTGTNLGFAVFLVGWIMQVRGSASQSAVSALRRDHVRSPASSEPATGLEQTLSNICAGHMPTSCFPQAVVIFGYPYTPGFIDNLPLGTVLFALCPWTLLSKAVIDMGQASTEGQPGISWADRFGCGWLPPGLPVCNPIAAVMPGTLTVHLCIPDPTAAHHDAFVVHLNFAAPCSLIASREARDPDRSPASAVTVCRRCAAESRQLTTV